MTVVVAMEHLDGSAVIAQYHDHKGRRRWVEHAYANVPFDDVPMADRTKQLRQVGMNLGCLVSGPYFWCPLRLSALHDVLGKVFLQLPVCKGACDEIIEYLFWGYFRYLSRRQGNLLLCFICAEG